MLIKDKDKNNICLENYITLKSKRLHFKDLFYFLSGLNILATFVQHFMVSEVFIRDDYQDLSLSLEARKQSFL